MITIKDGIHGHIDIDGVARDLIDTPEVQRLRRIRQLGNTSLVYPSANHTRFEHSLGVYYLANQAIDQLDIKQHNKKCIRAAAILHDIGHGPFSHNTEPLIKHHLNKSHDDVDEILQTGQVNEVLLQHGIDPSHITELIAGKGRYGQLISGDLDVDRMDYLARDAHHTGVPYGTIDHEHLIHSLTFDGSKLVIGEGNKQAAENMLTARTFMNPTVYHHPATRVSETMLLRAAEILITENVIPASNLRDMDDHDLVAELRKNESTADLISRLNNRNLYKRAVWIGIDAVPESIIDASWERIRSLESEIAEKSGIDSKKVVLDIPDRPSISESDTSVIEAGKAKPLAEASAIISALEVANREQWRLGVYTEKDHIENVKNVVDEVLGTNLDQELIKERTNARNTHDLGG